MKFSAIILGLSTLALATHAVAISFDITVVEASKSGSSLDSALGPYKRQLVEMGYRSGKIISRQSLSAALNEKKDFRVKGNISAEITPTSVENGFINFDFKMVKGTKTIVRLSYRIPDGIHTIIVGPSEKKKKYIVIIRATE